MDWYLYPLTVAAGMLAGFINTLAGNGSAVSLAMLGFIGLDANIANGTNRVAILLQNVVAVRGFHKRKMLDAVGALWLAGPAVAGAVLGALVAVKLDEGALRIAIGCLMLVILALLFVKPRRFLEARAPADRKRPGLGRMAVFFAIGAYGGFIQMGVGIFLLVALVLAVGYDLVRANAVKVLIILCFTIPALGIFIYHGQVRWDVGVTLAAGNMLGAWIATREAARRGASFVRYLLMAVVTLAAARYLGLFDLLGGLF